jgi:hypothetical protein
MLKTLALAGLAALTLGTAASAAEISITVRDSWQRVSDHRGGFERGGWERGGFDEERRPRRFIEERRERFDHSPRYGYDDDGFRSFPERRRWNPVAERHGFDRGWHHRDCRVIVKRRVNPWGDLVVKRIKICD